MAPFSGRRKLRCTVRVQAGRGGVLEPKLRSNPWRLSARLNKEPRPKPGLLFRPPLSLSSVHQVPFTVSPAAAGAGGLEDAERVQDECGKPQCQDADDDLLCGLHGFSAQAISHNAPAAMPPPQGSTGEVTAAGGAGAPSPVAILPRHFFSSDAFMTVYPLPPS